MEGGALAAPPLIKYPAETTEAFCDGHNAAFVFFDGVPISILYDNTKLAVARILSDGKRQRTRVFMELQSHYLFEDRFGRPGIGLKNAEIARILDRHGLLKRKDPDRRTFRRVPGKVHVTVYALDRAKMGGQRP